MQKAYSVWLHLLEIPEPVKVRLLKTFKSFQAVYKAEKTDYEKGKVPAAVITRLLMSKNQLDKAEELIQQSMQQKIRVIDFLDDDYPKLLKEIADPPMVLFLRGDEKILNTPILGIVGSRNCSEYGLQMTFDFAQKLAGYGMTIISGMALGIDEAAHQGALKSGKTIAVLGTGVNRCYPSQNKMIYAAIPDRGCLVSEYPLDSPPLPYHFPRRNRIISGMSLGVLVTEAALRSGSLITANYALEQGREVFAIPGDIRKKLSKGTNELIIKGAKCVTEIDEIIEEFPEIIQKWIGQNKKNDLKKMDNELAQDESIVYAYVSQEPIFLKELIKCTHLSYEQIYVALVNLENKGYVKRIMGERYIRAQ